MNPMPTESISLRFLDTSAPSLHCSTSGSGSGSRIGERDIMHHIPDLDLDNVKTDLDIFFAGELGWVVGGVITISSSVAFGILQSPGNADVEAI